MTVVGLLDVVTVSNSAEFRSFLLIMCIDAQESTTSSLSSSSRVDGVGKQLCSESEKNAVPFFSFFFKIFLASLHAASIVPSDGFWSRMLAWHITALVSWTHRIGFNMFELFRKNDEDFGDSKSQSTQPNCCVFFNMATALLSRPFARLFIYQAMRSKTLFPKPASLSGLVEQTFWRMPLFTQWSGASSFEVIFAGRSRHSFTWTLASGTSGSRCISLVLPRGRSWRRIRMSIFARLSVSCQKLQALPVSFPLPTVSKTLSTLFCPLILDHGVCLIIPSGIKNSQSVDSARHFFFDHFFNLW